MAKQMPLFPHQSDARDHRNFTLSCIQMLDKRGGKDSKTTVYAYNGSYWVRQEIKRGGKVEVVRHRFDNQNDAMTLFKLI